MNEDETTFKLDITPSPGLSFAFKKPDYLVIPYKEYLKLCSEREATVDAMKITIISEKTEKTIGDLILITPKIIREEIKISGSLAPGMGQSYGAFSSCLQIEVSITWTPSDQIVGIAIVDAETGQGYGYWFTGGSARVSFSTDWTKTYYILILSHPENTEVINYNGKIITWTWKL